MKYQMGFSRKAAIYAFQFRKRKQVKEKREKKRKERRKLEHV
jgi:hypothetical protein